MLVSVLATGIGAPVLTAWIADQLPKKGEPLSEVNRKLRNIALASLASIALSYIVFSVAKPTTTTTIAKEIDLVRVD